MATGNQKIFAATLVRAEMNLKELEPMLPSSSDIILAKGEGKLFLLKKREIEHALKYGFDGTVASISREDICYFGDANPRNFPFAPLRDAEGKVGETKADRFAPVRLKVSFDSATAEVVNIASEIAKRAGAQIWLVGGAIRDILSGKVPRGLDFAFNANFNAFIGALETFFPSEVEVFDRCLSVHTPLGDFTRLRREEYRRPGIAPVGFPANLEEDARRRDFAANALYLDVTSGKLLDPYGGLGDIEKKILWPISSIKFIEDPTRAIRYIRFKLREGYSLDRDGERFLRVSMGFFSKVGFPSSSRILYEIDKLFEETHPISALRELHRIGFLDALLKGFCSHKVDEETVTRMGREILRVCEAFGKRRWLSAAVFCLFIEEERVKDFLTSFSVPKEEKAAILKVLLRG